jgi:para-nitrobenzyl esterase
MSKLAGDGRWIAPATALVVSLLFACGEDKQQGEEADAGWQGDSGAGPGTDASAGGDPTTVTLDDGELLGEVVEGEAVRFLKIPYAKPPVGPLRWKAPEPPEPWSGVRQETEFSSPCPQAQSQQSEASSDEDCLYLNVWRPADNTSRAPVMVWIHGGGFTTGSAADRLPMLEYNLWYDGRVFAGQRGVVVVTINYRLGVMGFFAHPALADEGSPVGNQGLLDQQQALRWVRDNIEAFGGDPDNVTIFGQSAGSGSVCMHLVSPGSRGLFHRAVSQSGGCTTGRATDRAAVDEQHVAFASERGCEGDDVLDCLRAKPVDEIVDMEFVLRTGGMERLRQSFDFGVVVDGEGGFLPEPAGDLFDRGELARVPYMLGSTNDESKLYYLSAPVPSSDEEYVAEINDRYGDFAERVLEIYPISRFDGDYREAMARIATDSGMVCSTHETARRAVRAGLPVYMFNFNIPWSIARDLMGACHASEISHVFGTPLRETEENIQVAEVMNTYWATFARTGDPNYQGAPVVWPRFEPDENDDDQRIQFDPDYEILDSFRKQECALWRDWYAQQ